MSQQNKTTLQAAINSQIADNNSGDISAADVRNNLINMTDSLIFNESTSQAITGSLTATSFTGSLQGTATTASYVVTAQTASYVLNAVSASYAISASYEINYETSSSYAETASIAYTASYVQTAQTASYVQNSISSSFSSTASFVQTAQTASYVQNAQTASFFSGTVTSASYAATSSLSDTTLGAGDPLNTNGGEIQFRGGFGLGSPNGKNTWSSAFIWSNAYSGLNIGDPNTTGGYGDGNYYLAVGYDSLANGLAVAFGSSSHAYGEGSFTHGEKVTAIGDYSYASGFNTIANGMYSRAIGFNATASGLYATSNGQFTIALGNYSHATGRGTISSGSYQYVNGQYNTEGDNTSLMIVGNGVFGARQDAFKVRMSGSIVLPTTQSSIPSWTGTDGEMVFATVTGNHRFYVWMAGAWRSGSLA
jgi:hypothetical protein